MASILFIASDAVLAIMSTVGAYYSVKARGLFFKDIMGRVFGLLVVWFGLLALVTVVDIFSLGFISTVIPLVQIGEIIATAPLVIAVIMLIRWANSSPKSRTEP